MKSKITWLACLTLLMGAIAYASLSHSADDKKTTGHANVGECAWNKCCGAESDGSPNAYCRWVAGVDCCNKSTKLAQHGTHSGDAATGWDYDCSANTCPDADDCAEKEVVSTANQLTVHTPDQ